MKIENLKIFLEVAQSESINEAARNLFMSHQNLNKIIKNLETELNTALFVRTNKGIQLTSNGRELFVTASQIVRNYESFLGKLNNAETDILKFYTLPSQSMLASSLQGKRFGERYLSVYKRDFDELVKMIQSGKIGIYFLPLMDETVLVAPETTRYTIASSDLITYVCHEKYLEQYRGKSFNEFDKLVSNTSKKSLDSLAINIDDIQVRKKLMRDEGFICSTEYQLYLAEFPENEWFVIYQEAMPEYRVSYTLFFNLPNTAEYQQLQQIIINNINDFFFPSKQ